MQERISLSEDLQIPKAAREVIKRKAFHHFHGNILMTPVIFITLEKKSLVNSYLIFLWKQRMLSFLTSESACSVCVCLYVVCVYVYVCVCGLYVHLCFVHSWCVCVNVCFCICVYVYAYVCLYVCVWYLGMYICVDVCI